MCIRDSYDDWDNLSEYQCVGRDNTEKHEAAKKINRYIREMEFLAQASRDFRDMDETGDIFEYTARRVYSLAPGFLAWIGLIDLHQRTLRIRSVVGDPDSIRQLDQILGKRFVGMVFPIDLEETSALLQRRTLVRAPSLYRLLHMQFSEDVCQRIEEASLGGIDSYLMGLVSGGRIVGDVGISLPHGTPLPNRGLIEAFIRQAAIAIEWKITETSLRQSLARKEEEGKKLQFLSGTAMDFIGMDDSSDIWRYTVEKIMAITESELVAIRMYDMSRTCATTRSVAASPELQRVLQEHGIDPVGMTTPLVPGTRPEEGAPICSLLFNTVPDDIRRSLEEKLSPGESYIMEIGHQGRSLGSVVIMPGQGREVANRELLEAFITQAASALFRQTRR